MLLKKSNVQTLCSLDLHATVAACAKAAMCFLFVLKGRVSLSSSSPVRILLLPAR